MEDNEIYKGLLALDLGLDANSCAECAQTLAAQGFTLIKQLSRKLRNASQYKYLGMLEITDELI
jgi:hypothetical protein